MARSAQQKKHDQQLDRYIARGAWLAIFLALVGAALYIRYSHDTLSGVLLAVFFPMVFGVIAYIFSPGDKDILVHLAKEWRVALALFIVSGASLGSFLAYQHWKTPPPPKKVIKIGIDLPTTGVDKSEGLTVLNGIKMAIDEAGPIDGHTIEPYSLSDDNTVTGLNDPDNGAINVNEFLKDTRVAGIIGPYNSGVALRVIPIINGQNDGGQKIAMVSPSATADCLTTHIYPTNGCDNLNNQGLFFRLAALNNKAGEVFANCLSYPAQGSSDLCPSPDLHKYKTVLVIDDSTPYSVGFAKSFKQFWEQKNNKAVGKQVANKASRASLKDVLRDGTKELGTTPDVVFFAGSEENAKTLHQIMLQSANDTMPNLSRTPFASSASIMNDDFVRHLRDNPTTGPVYVAPPIRTLTNEDSAEQLDSRNFAARYLQTYKTKHTPYSAAGYDAAKIMIQAIREAAGKGGLPDPANPAAVQEFRKKVAYSIKNPADSAVAGLTGRYSFDENGDFKDAAVSVFKWNPKNKYGWDYQ